MRPFYLIASVLAFLVLALPAIAQSAAKDEIATVARALDDLEARWEANDGGVSRADLDVWTKRAAGTGDIDVMFRFYRLFTAVAEREGDRSSEVDGRLRVALMRHAIEGALTSTAARANFELGHAFVGLDGFRDQQQFALMNALSVFDAFVRTGVRNAEIVGLQAWSNALLGTNLLRSGWPGPALYYLRSAVVQADVAEFSEGNKTGLNNLVKQAQASASAIPPPSADIACDEATEGDQQRRDACLSRADVLWSQGDVAGAEVILSRLAGSITCRGLNESRQEIVRRIMLLRALRERPGQPALRQAICAVANQVAGRGVKAASTLAMPTIQTYVDRGLYDAEIADMAAHLAWRWMRIREDQFAWFFMEVQSKLLEKLPPRNLPPHSSMDQMRQQKLTQSLIALDRAYLAERNGWAAVGVNERAKAIAAAEAIDVQDIDRLRDDLQTYWQSSYGFMTPTSATAAEFYARVARRLPAGDERRRVALTFWLDLELSRGDDARAERIATELIEQARRDGNPERITLAKLLDQYADIVRQRKPEAADSAQREALAIIIAEPGRETARLIAMLKLENDRRALGDIAGAERFFNEAMILRNSATGLNENSISFFDMRHAAKLWDAGERTKALELAEDAMQRIEAATARTGDDWLLLATAQPFALLNARAGQIERVREVYRKHILPTTDLVSVHGDGWAITARMNLASLEAVYGPTGETIKRLEVLLANAANLLPGTLVLQESAWRSLAFAHLGMGAHREALEAARRSSTFKPPQGTESEQDEWNRRLAETHVAAVWRVAR